MTNLGILVTIPPEEPEKNEMIFCGPIVEVEVGGHKTLWHTVTIGESTPEKEIKKSSKST